MRKKNYIVHEWTAIVDSVLEELLSIADETILIPSSNGFVLSLNGKGRSVFGSLLARRIHDFPKDSINIVVDSCDPCRNWRNKDDIFKLRIIAKPDTGIVIDEIGLSMLSRWTFAKYMNAQVKSAQFICFDAIDYIDAKPIILSDLSIFGDVEFDDIHSTIIEDGNKSFNHSSDSQWKNDIISSAVRTSISSLDI